MLFGTKPSIWSMTVATITPRICENQRQRTVKLECGDSWSISMEKIRRKKRGISIIAAKKRDFLKFGWERVDISNHQKLENRQTG